MPIVELESAPDQGATSFAGMSAETDMAAGQVTLKLSDELRNEIRAEYEAHVGPEKLAVAVRLVRDCPKCGRALHAPTSVLVEYGKRPESGLPRQLTSFVLCSACADTHCIDAADAAVRLELERSVVDGRLIKWD